MGGLLVSYSASHVLPSDLRLTDGKKEKQKEIAPQGRNEIPLQERKKGEITAPSALGDVSEGRAVEEVALPLPGKNNCHVGGAQRWFSGQCQEGEEAKSVTPSEQVLGVVPLRE